MRLRKPSRKGLGLEVLGFCHRHHSIFRRQPPSAILSTKENMMSNLTEQDHWEDDLTPAEIEDLMEILREEELDREYDVEDFRPRFPADDRLWGHIENGTHYPY